MGRRKRKSRNYSKYVNCARKMPPLRLVYDGYKNDVEFDFSKSPLMQWIINQPDIQKYLYNYITHTGFIKYDNDLKLWIGIDYFNPKTE